MKIYVHCKARGHGCVCGCSVISIEPAAPAATGGVLGVGNRCKFYGVCVRMPRTPRRRSKKRRSKRQSVIAAAVLSGLVPPIAAIAAVKQRSKGYERQLDRVEQFVMDAQIRGMLSDMKEENNIYRQKRIYGHTPCRVEGKDAAAAIGVKAGMTARIVRFHVDDLSSKLGGTFAHRVIEITGSNCMTMLGFNIDPYWEHDNGGGMYLHTFDKYFSIIRKRIFSCLRDGGGIKCLRDPRSEFSKQKSFFSERRILVDRMQEGNARFYPLGQIQSDSVTLTPKHIGVLNMILRKELLRDSHTNDFGERDFAFRVPGFKLDGGLFRAIGAYCNYNSLAQNCDTAARLFLNNIDYFKNVVQMNTTQAENDLKNSFENVIPSKYSSFYKRTVTQWERKTNNN